MVTNIEKNIMFGYSMEVRRLTEEDIRIHGVKVEPRSNLDNCVAVEPADLGPCLGAVVDLVTGEVLWSDADGKGTPLENAEEFGKALQLVILSMFPHFKTYPHFQ